MGEPTGWRGRSGPLLASQSPHKAISARSKYMARWTVQRWDTDTRGWITGSKLTPTGSFESFSFGLTAGSRGGTDLSRKKKAWAMVTFGDASLMPMGGHFTLATGQMKVKQFGSLPQIPGQGVWRKARRLCGFNWSHLLLTLGVRPEDSHCAHCLKLAPRS